MVSPHLCKSEFELSQKNRKTKFHEFSEISKPDSETEALET